MRLLEENGWSLPEGGVLRPLRESDAGAMLEWMHDPEIAKCFARDFLDATIDDAAGFVEHANSAVDSLHLAIQDPATGEYLGTISLKDIDFANLKAEYAVSTCKAAHGTGIARKATEELLAFAFDVMGLHKVYLNVRADNKRAIRFYEKAGFVREGLSKDALRTQDGYVDLEWFAVMDE